MRYATSRIILIPCGMNWHVIKYTHFRDMNLITYLEDTLGTWQVPRLFKETTLENAVVVLRQTINWDTPKVQSRCQHPSFNGTVCQACPVPVPLWSLCSFWKSWSEPCPFRLLPVPYADECIHKVCGAYPYYLVAFVAKFFERPCGFVDIFLWDCISFACHEFVYGLLDTWPCVSVRSFIYFLMRCILLAVYETLIQS